MFLLKEKEARVFVTIKYIIVFVVLLTIHADLKKNILLQYFLLYYSNENLMKTIIIAVRKTQNKKPECFTVMRIWGELALK